MAAEIEQDIRENGIWDSPGLPRKDLLQIEKCLPGIFGIVCFTQCVTCNDLHLFLRSRPDVLASWSDQEVARLWLRLFPEWRSSEGPPESADPEIQMIATQPDVPAEIRRRLGDISS